jgi:hypothetical protein
LFKIRVAELHVDIIVRGVKVAHAKDRNEVLVAALAELHDCTPLVLNFVPGDGSERFSQFAREILSVILMSSPLIIPGLWRCSASTMVRRPLKQRKAPYEPRYVGGGQ